MSQRTWRRRACTATPPAFVSGRVEEIGSDGRCRGDPEQQHEKRRHQRAAADAGQADDGADGKPGESVHEIHRLRARAREKPQSANQAGAHRAVGGFVDQDEGAGRAIVGVAIREDRLCERQREIADIVARERLPGPATFVCVVVFHR